jgi:hypothetical protein
MLRLNLAEKFGSSSERMLLYFCLTAIFTGSVARPRSSRSASAPCSLIPIVQIRYTYFIPRCSVELDLAGVSLSEATWWRALSPRALPPRRRFDQREGARCVQSHDEGPRFQQRDSSICKNHIYLLHKYRRLSLNAERISIDDAMTLNLLLVNTENQRKALLDFQTDFATSQTALICWQAKHGKQGQKVVMQ